MTVAPPLASRSLLRDEVRERITARILGGEYAPGHRLVELRIAAELGVSQSVVREALRELEGLNLVEHAAYKGSRVRDPSAAEAAAMLPVRSALETLAVELSGDRLPLVVPGLERRLAAMRAAAASGDRYAFVVNDEGFHGELVAGAQNAPLSHAFAAVGVGAVIFATIARKGMDLHDVAESHVPVIEACRGGSAPAAVAALTVHLASAA